MKYTPEITQLIVRAYESGKTAKEIAEMLSNMGTETSDTRGTCGNLGSEKQTTSDTDSFEQTSAEQTNRVIVPERSVIAKLSSLGIYKKKEYLTKRGETPIKKEEYIERIAALLDVNSDMLESLEKVNKSVLALLEQKLK